MPEAPGSPPADAPAPATAAPSRGAALPITPQVIALLTLLLTLVTAVVMLLIFTQGVEMRGVDKLAEGLEKIVRTSTPDLEKTIDRVADKFAEKIGEKLNPIRVVPPPPDVPALPLSPLPAPPAPAPAPPGTPPPPGAPPPPAPRVTIIAEPERYALPTSDERKPRYDLRPGEWSEWIPINGYLCSFQFHTEDSTLDLECRFPGTAHPTTALTVRRDMADAKGMIDVWQIKPDIPKYTPFELRFRNEHGGNVNLLLHFSRTPPSPR